MPTQIYFIDTKLDNYQIIINSLSSTDKYFLIDSSSDGLTQMSNILLNYSNLDSIHVYSHGSVGSLNIGNSIYDNTNILNYKIVLENIGKSLSSTGDIFLYGCNVGQDEVGLNFINQIAQYTQADVAGSDDLTGNKVLGGDWDLESTTGNIEANNMSIFSYNNLLAFNTAPSFAIGDGLVETNISGSDSAKSVVIQSDGKILVTGASALLVNGPSGWVGNYDFTLVRYNNYGQLDTAFGNNGKVIVDFGLSDYSSDVLLQSDKKILVSGYSRNGDNNDFALIRCNSDGSLDSSFGSNGKVIIDSLGADNYDSRIALQNDGKILIAGSNNGVNNDFALIRCNSDGSLDASFGNNGQVIVDISGQDQSQSVTIQADGKILLVGNSYDGQYGQDFTILRFNVNGDLDDSFGNGGIVISSIQNSSNSYFIHDVVLQQDQKILVVGSLENFNGLLARYNSDGTLDTSFGNSTGVVNLNFVNWAENMYSVALQTDGKIVVGGYISYYSDVKRHDFALARYNQDGTLDKSFNQSGKVFTDFGLSVDIGYSIAIQEDGKIIIVGESNNNFALARFNSDGTIDKTFDSLTSLDSVSDYIENNSAVIFDSDVQIYDHELYTANNYDGSTLTLARHNGSSSEDQFSGLGIIAGQFSGEVSIFSNIVGTYSYNNGTLVITFNSNATQTLVNQTLQTLAYSNSSDNPPSSVQIDWFFNDGNTGTQGTGGALETIGSVTVNITAINETPTITSIATGTVTENAVNTTVIYKVTATDVDGTTPTYSLSGADASLLNIDSTTGDVTLKSSANYETKKSYSFNVISSDGSLTATKAITVNVTNVNEAPTITSSSSGSVAENAVNTTVIYKTTATDVDANTTLKYSLSGTDTSLLNIDSTTGNVTLKSSANYEVKSSYSFNVMASDGEIGHIKAITVNVTNVNEAPTITSSSSGSVAENAVNTTVIYKTTATDVDANTTLKYSLSGTDTSLLNIDSTTGNVTLKSSANYEVKSSYSFNVMASDGEIGHIKAITVNVTNVNEAPTITSSSSGSVAENALNTTVIYKTTATDVDANTTLKYSLSGTDASLLNINSSTGNVTLKTSANYEAKNKYIFNVIASDGSLTATKAVVVNVTNVNEFAPTSTNKIITINEDIVKVLTLTDFAFSDADANSTLSKVKITSLETKGSLKLNGLDVTLNKEILASDIKANKLTFTPTSNEFGTSYSNFKFQVSDGTKYSISSYTTTFNVTQVIDTVSKSTTYTLPNLIENLTLTGITAINGTGNTLNNIITGNSANNILDGKTGADTLNGRLGNDTLYGELGNDILNGAAGVDIMLGGAGNDTYYVDNSLDKVYETKTTSSTSGDATGIDTVNSSISYTLTSYVENLTLTGITGINGTGNTLNNVIIGNSAVNTLNGGLGNDILNGGLGNDILYGGLGLDKFVFNTAINSITNKDTIKDFNVKDDTIHLENAIFTKLSATGTLNTALFKANTDGKAKDSNDYLVYNKNTGQLFYDADGSGIGASVLFATIENKAALTYADFTVI